MEPKKVSNEGLAMIRSFEGCVLKAYKCPAGVWTIGYGHTKGVKPDMKITKEKAEELLMQDVASIEELLNKTFPNLTQQQFDALASFIFNLGWTNFKSSTLYKRIAEKASDKQVCMQLLRWYNANKKPLVGLMKRRVAEANMWCGRQAYAVEIKNNTARIVEL